jgi:hypothetical protein
MIGNLLLVLLGNKTTLNLNFVHLSLYFENSTLDYKQLYSLMIIIKVYTDWVGTTHFNSVKDSLKL